MSRGCVCAYIDKPAGCRLLQMDQDCLDLSQLIVVFLPKQNQKLPNQIRIAPFYHNCNSILFNEKLWIFSITLATKSWVIAKLFYKFTNCLGLSLPSKTWLYPFWCKPDQIWPFLFYCVSRFWNSSIFFANNSLRSAVQTWSMLTAKFYILQKPYKAVKLHGEKLNFETKPSWIPWLWYNPWLSKVML